MYYPINPMSSEVYFSAEHLLVSYGQVPGGNQSGLGDFTESQDEIYKAVARAVKGWRSSSAAKADADRWARREHEAACCRKNCLKTYGFGQRFEVDDGNGTEVVVSDTPDIETARGVSRGGSEFA